MFTIDNQFILSGSFTCKAGWATSTAPNLVFKNILARPRKERGKKVMKLGFVYITKIYKLILLFLFRMVKH